MTGFPPLLGKAPKILVLGSMPSQSSLQKQQYYAHPQNAFWWIMAQLCGFNTNATYANRAQAIVESGVAVWDVLFDCERPGSLDSSIVKETEQANDFSDLIMQQPSIRLIAFNGGTAKSLFMRHCSQILNSHPALQWVQLPSTSPAYAAMTKAQKLQIWRDELPSLVC